MTDEEEQVKAVLAELGIAFPIRHEITIAKKLIEARVERDALRKVYEAAKAWNSAWLIATRIGGKEAVVLLESRCIALDEAVAERAVFEIAWRDA
jgi:hypothetical protein